MTRLFRMLELIHRFRFAVLALACAVIVLSSLTDAIGVTTSSVHAMASDTWESMYADSGGNYFVAIGWWISYQAARGIDAALGVVGYCLVTKTNGAC